MVSFGAVLFVSLGGGGFSSTYIVPCRVGGLKEACRPVLFDWHRPIAELVCPSPPWCFLLNLPHSSVYRVVRFDRDGRLFRPTSVIYCCCRVEFFYGLYVRRRRSL